VSQPNQTGDRLQGPTVHEGVPPEVYGGAGVHVEYMANELSEHVVLTVHCHRGPTGRPRWRTGHGTT
jgi:starch synthase